MEFSDFPTTHRLLIDEGMTPIEVIDMDKLVCTHKKSGLKFVAKEVRGIERKIYSEVFPAIKSQDLVFETLQLPECHKIIEKKFNNKTLSYIFIKYYEGINYNLKWDESLPKGYGGRGVEQTMVDKSIEILKDFSKIDIRKLSQYNIPIFNYEKWVTDIFPTITQELIEANVLTSNQVKRIGKLLHQFDNFKNSQLIFTNGDFYPRNFVQLQDGKVVVLDWEVRIDQPFRNAPINYLENHLAFLYVHMWGNQKFQRELLKVAHNTFDLSDRNLQVAIIIKSLEQAKLWLPYLESGSHLTLNQIQLLFNSLDNQYLNE